MKKAVILAAGEGQRLRPFTVNRPKTMISIAGKPILQYIVESLASNGIRNIVIVAGYRKEQVFNYFGNGDAFGVNIEYITQEKQLGTADALLKAREAVGGEFLVLPGDNLIEAATISRFAQVNPHAVLVKSVQNSVRFGVISAENGLLKEIIERPEEPVSGLVNTGIYSFTDEIFDYIETESGIPDVINLMINNGCEVRIHETEGAWMDAVYPWDILSLNDAVLPQVPSMLGGTIENGASVSGLVSIGKDTIIRSNSYIVGPVIIGSNCDIGPNVYIAPATSIGDNVVISPFTEVRNSVIGDDVHVGSGSIIQDSVIDDGCVIGGNFTACSSEAEIRINTDYHKVNIGVMMGTGCSLGSGVVGQPGVIIGNQSRIQSMKLVSGRLPDKSLVI